MSLRVLLVGPYPLDPGRVTGGVQTSFVNLVSGLSELEDVHAEVVTFAQGPDRAPARATTVDGVTVNHVLGSRRLGFLSRHARERRLLRELIDERRPDVVHAQDVLASGYVCLKAVDRTPVLVTIHGIVREEFNHLPRGRERLRARLFAIGVERFCVENARFLVASTRYVEHYFDGEIRGRIWNVPNPIAEKFFAAEPRPDEGRILYTGTIVPRKRLMDLVEALPRVLANVPVAHLNVVGPGEDVSYERAVRQRIAELGLEGFVTFLGSLSPEALVAEYELASVLALPSGQETSPLVVGEAMAAGVPVVATAVGGVPYLVEPGRSGHLAAVGDVETLAQRLVEVLGDPHAQRALGAAGRAKAEREFRVSAVARRVRSIYEETRELST